MHAALAIHLLLYSASACVVDWGQTCTSSNRIDGKCVCPLGTCACFLFVSKMKAVSCLNTSNFTLACAWAQEEQQEQKQKQQQGSSGSVSGGGEASDDGNDGDDEDLSTVAIVCIVIGGWILCGVLATLMGSKVRESFLGPGPIVSMPSLLWVAGGPFSLLLVLLMLILKG